VGNGAEVTWCVARQSWRIGRLLAGNVRGRGTASDTPAGRPTADLPTKTLTRTRRAQSRSCTRDRREHVELREPASSLRVAISSSQTDTEVLATSSTSYSRRASLVERAVALRQVKGASPSRCCLTAAECPGAAKNASPRWWASATAKPYRHSDHRHLGTNPHHAFLEDGDIVDVDRSGARITDLQGNRSCAAAHGDLDSGSAEKAAIRFMLKDLEQPHAVTDTLRDACCDSHDAVLEDQR